MLNSRTITELIPKPTLKFQLTDSISYRMFICLYKEKIVASSKKFPRSTLESQLKGVGKSIEYISSFVRPCNNKPRRSAPHRLNRALCGGSPVAARCCYIRGLWSFNLHTLQLKRVAHILYNILKKRDLCQKNIKLGFTMS